MFFEFGSALARRPSARLKRLCPFTIFTNCFGSKVRDSGQSLVPEPPHRIIFVMFFLFLCEILRHYSKIWQIDLNLFLFFAVLFHIRWLLCIRWLLRICFFASHPMVASHPLVGGAGVFLGNSRIFVIASEAKQSLGILNSFLGNSRIYIMNSRIYLRNSRIP